MVSVRMNTNGHSSVPAVKLSEPVWPNRFHSSGATPSVSSNAKILTPINSASTALAQNTAASTMKRRTARSSSVRAACMAQRSPARVNGIASGATAPPEMMKLIA